MKKILLFLNILFAINLISQTTITGTPAHAYAIPSTNGNNNFFNPTAAYKKFQFVYSNSELSNFTTPIATSVEITQLWFKHTGTTPPTTTLANFKITLGHSNTLPNALDTNFNTNFNSGPQNVCFTSAPTLVYTVSGAWVGITLNTPFLYDGISNLAIMIEYTGSTAAIANNIIGNSAQVVSAASISATQGLVSQGRPYIGFGSKAPCAVPIFALPPDIKVCGTNAIPLNVPVIVNNTALYSYQWQIKNPSTAAGVNNGTGLSINTTPNVNAMYVLIVKNIPFTCSRRDSILVTYAAPAPNFSLGPDISFCGVAPNYNNTTQLKPLPSLITPTTGLTFQWTGLTLPPGPQVPILGIPTPTAQTTTPTQAGQYVLTVTRTAGSCTTTDTIKLTTPTPKFTLPNDTVICNGVPLTINAPANVIAAASTAQITYAWFSHPGASATPLTPLGSGNSIVAPLTNTDHWYVLVASSPLPGVCIKKDSIRVKYTVGGVPFTLVPDAFFCKTPNIIQLKPVPAIAPTAGLTFTWTALDLVANTAVALVPAPTNNQIYTPTINQGRYILTVKDALGCITRDTVKLIDKSVPTFLMQPRDTSICNSTNTYPINVPTIVSSTATYSYTWIVHPLTSYTPNVVTPIVSSITTNATLPPSYYTLNVSNSTCSKRDSIKVRYVNIPTVEIGSDTQYYCGNAAANTNLGAPIGKQIAAVPALPTTAGFVYAWTGRTIPPAAPGIISPPTPTLQTTTPPQPGKYILTLTKEGCKSRDSVIFLPLIPTFKFVPKDTSFCSGQPSFTVNAPAIVSATSPFGHSWYKYEIGFYGLGSVISTTNSALATPFSDSLGDYYVLTVNNGTCLRKDSMRVRFGAPTPINLINDTFYCKSANNVQLKPMVPLPTLPIAPSNVYAWTGVTIAPNPSPGSVITGITTPTVQTTTPTVPGKYYLRYTNIAGCKSIDSVLLNNYKVVIPLTPTTSQPLLISSLIGNKTNDTILCKTSSYAMKGTTLPVNIAPFIWRYSWYKVPDLVNAVSTIQNYTATATPGGAAFNQYLLLASNGFCQDSDKINVVFSSLPVVSLGPDDTLCTPFTKTLVGPFQPPNTNYTYNWSQILPIAQLAVSKDYITGSAGTFVLTVTNQYNCVNKDTIKVNGRSIAPFSLGNDTGTCIVNGVASIPINGPTNPFPSPNLYKYSWNTNPIQTTKNITISGAVGPGASTYVLTVTNGPCKLKDSIVVELQNKPIFQLPNDTNICGKNLYQITIQPDVIDPTLNYVWSNGTLGPVNTINFDGKYVLTASNKYCSTIDSFRVVSRVKPILNDLGPDKEYCDNESISLTLDPITNYFPLSPFLIKWKPGNQTTKSINVFTPGKYIVTVKNGLNCEASDSITIKTIKVPIIDMVDSLFICGTGSFLIDPKTNAQSYLWNTGSTDSSIIVTEPGLYTVEAGNGRCKATAATIVDKLNPFSIGNDIDFCPENENPTISIPNVTKVFAWEKLDDGNWLNPNPKRDLIIAKPGIYVGSITKGNCTLYDTITINAFKNQNVFIPNSFSPNDNNGINPEYYIKATDVKDFNIKVFTKFGEVLFESNDPKFKWDGKSKKGVKLMSGAYVYSVSYKSYCAGDELFRENGILNIF